MKELLLALFDTLTEAFAPPILKPFLTVARMFISQLRLETAHDNARAVVMFRTYIERARGILAENTDQQIIDAALISLEVELGQALKDAGLLPTG